MYVTGKFTSARPAGAPAGTNETTRNNLLAYDIRTGQLITSFAPSLNGQGLAIAASPDGSRIYVGGDFTTADGQSRSRIAAYSTATGQLISTFKPAMGSTVQAIAATGTTVYVGGGFSSVGGVSRTRLAALGATDGSLLPWAPVPAAGVTDGKPAKGFGVRGLLVTNGGAQVVVAGSFGYLNGAAYSGIGALDAVTGANRPFQMGQILTNQGDRSAVYSLSTDGTTVFGTAYDYNGGGGNTEGSFAVTPDGGRPVWVNDCHGDSYSSFPTNGVLYIASHSYDCASVGGFPYSTSVPGSPNPYHFATAVTTAATSTRTDTAWSALGGLPASTMVDWFPTLTNGSVTGQNQAGWTVSANSSYVVYGGEFPSVNGTAQAGLVRFALPGGAPNKVGPRSWAALKPTVASVTAGAARVSWQTTWDQDNETLTYQVRRSDRPDAPVYTTTASSRFYQLSTLRFVDTGLVPGRSYTYTVTAVDPYGNQQVGAATTVTASSATPDTGAYVAAVTADRPTDFWRLDQPVGSSTAYDSAGSTDLTINSGVTLGSAGLVSGSQNTAATFDGSEAGFVVAQSTVRGPQVFSIEATFSTTSTSGGKILGLGDSATGNSGSNDRNLYLDAAGHVKFGVWDGWTQIASSTATYNDGKPHHVVATYGSGVITLYVDGAVVGRRTGVNGAQDFSGYWRIGGDSSWEGSRYFAGTIDDVAIYPTVLSAAQVARHAAVQATGQIPNTAPTATLTATVTGLDVALDGSGSTDAEGPVASYGWTFGDGSSGSGSAVSHAYGAAGTYRVTLTVVDGGGMSATWSQDVTVAPLPNTAPTGDFSASVDGLSVAVDGASSSDVDGAVATWAWDFGDGATATGVAARHTYTSAGSYTVRLSVTDDDGAQDTTTRVVVVSAPNQAPTASFTSSTAYLVVDVDGSGSTDADGQVRSYAWDFGDGGTATGATARHTFTAAGTFTVSLTVTDDRGATAASSRTLTVAAAPPPNQSPTAAFTASMSDLQVVLDGRTSADADGTLTGYAWDFGDGTSGTGATTTHRYAAAGSFTVTLTVTDNSGASGVTTSSVVATSPANVAPTAAFSTAVAGLAVSLDGSGSADADGTVTGYAWDFGDGTTGSGRTVSHTYLAGGAFTVTLTVVDDRQGSASASASVAVVAPTVFAQDAFGRAIAAGWGTADVGGSWAVTGTASVAGGVGQLAGTSGKTSTASLAGNRDEVAIQATVVVPQTPTGGGTYVSVAGQRVGGSEYRVKLWFRSSGVVQATLVRVVDGAETTLATYDVPGSATPGTSLTVRLDLSGAPTGTTTLRAKVWVTGAVEPAGWNVQSTDSTASLQRAGGIRITHYVSGSATASSTARVDDLWVGPSGSAPGR